jgi:hypothetical protein
MKMVEYRAYVEETCHAHKISFVNFKGRHPFGHIHKTSIGFNDTSLMTNIKFIISNLMEQRPS